jgi:lysophospholipase L1-like esterase
MADVTLAFEAFGEVRSAGSRGGGLYAVHEFRSFVAIGDSFTEGYGDYYPDGGCQGWADRFARLLAAESPDLRYANLAIRGKLLHQVISEQIPPAIAQQPDLISLAAGGNDLLRPKADPQALAATFEQAVIQLREAAGQVLLFSGALMAEMPLMRLIRDKVIAYNARIKEIAAQHDCLHVELASMAVLADRRFWCPDRLHLAEDGHRRVALLVAETVGLPVGEDWRVPLPPAPTPRNGWLSARRQDLRWARTYAAPWIWRRVRGVSSGDGLPAKRPDLLPL